MSLKAGTRGRATKIFRIKKKLFFMQNMAAKEKVQKIYLKELHGLIN
jgi:hypothetical protein